MAGSRQTTGAAHDGADGRRGQQPRGREDGGGSLSPLSATRYGCTMNTTSTSSRRRGQLVGGDGIGGPDSGQTTNTNFDSRSSSASGNVSAWRTLMDGSSDDGSRGTTPAVVARRWPDFCGLQGCLWNDNQNGLHHPGKRVGNDDHGQDDCQDWIDASGAAAHKGLARRSA